MRERSLARTAWRRVPLTLAAVLLAGLIVATAAAPALGSFPYTRPAGDPTDYKDLYLDPGQVPSDVGGDDWKYAATPEPGYPGDPLGIDLGGVRGAHIVDPSTTPPTAWETTTGRPDVQIAVLDSGIEWNNQGAMANERFKVWLNKGELPTPNTGLDDAGSTTESLLGTDCAGYTAGRYDANGDGVFNLRDYACDNRINLSDTRRSGPSGMLTPEDLTIAFSDDTDADGNGFVDDIAGWDFLDNDNDPYDDVQYGHGTGEAQDSTAEADNGQGDVGSCPNCVVMPLRVGDSFIADINNFAQAALYATDNGALVIQEALGTLNNSRLAREAVNYAYDHGTTVIASAADEAAQHNNWPSSLPHVILVNSVTKYDSGSTPQSYLEFNGCTNFSAKVTVAIPSSSCSSEATGKGSGIAGLIYSAALDAHDRGKLDPSTDCTRAVDVDGTPGDDPCIITPNEVRQLMASGTIDGTGQADDVDFFKGLNPDSDCTPPVAGCTDPYTTANIAGLDAVRPVVPTPPLGALAPSRSYPARAGHDQFYGYGRVNAAKAVGALVRSPLGDSSVKSLIPPEVEITSPQWFDQIDPVADQLRRHRARLSALGLVGLPLHGARRPGPIPEQRRGAGRRLQAVRDRQLRRPRRRNPRHDQYRSAQGPVPLGHLVYRGAAPAHAGRRQRPAVQGAQRLHHQGRRLHHSGHSQPDRRGRARDVAAPRRLDAAGLPAQALGFRQHR